MRFVLVALCLLCAAPAIAEDSPWCQNIWLSRNTVMDRAGQCFATPLGRAVFDNSDCVEGEVRLSPLDRFIVEELVAMEQEFGCAVDTSANRIHPESLEWRDRLMDLWTVPVRAETEHYCGGYSGPARPLHAGISTSTNIIGHLEPGQNFNFSHDPMQPDWEYITVSDADHNRVGHGWVQGLRMSDDVCVFMAG